MDVVLLLASCVLFVTFLLFINHFVRDSSRSNVLRRNLPLSFLTIVYLVFSLVVFLYAFGVFSFSSREFLFLFVGKLFFESFVISLVLFSSSRNRSVFLPYLVVFVVFVLAFFVPSLFHLLIPVFLVIMLVSYLSFSPFHTSWLHTPLLYVFVSFFLYLSLLFSSVFSSWLLLFSSLLFFVFVYHFTSGLRSFRGVFSFERHAPFFDFFRHIVFIIVLSNFMFVGTIGVHEAGHAVAARFFGCEGVLVLFSFGDAPHTLAECVTLSFHSWLVLGGVLFPVLLSLLLFFSGGKFIRELAIQMFSFNLMLSFADFLELGVPVVVAFSLFVFGVVSSLLSIGLLANARTSHL